MLKTMPRTWRSKNNLGELRMKVDNKVRIRGISYLARFCTYTLTQTRKIRHNILQIHSRLLLLAYLENRHIWMNWFCRLFRIYLHSPIYTIYCREAVEGSTSLE